MENDNISDDELDAIDRMYAKHKRKPERKPSPNKPPPGFDMRSKVCREMNGQLGPDRGQPQTLRAILVQEKNLNPERVAGLEWEAWHQRTLGQPVYKIAETMGVSVKQVNLWLADAMTQVKAKTQELIEVDKEVDINRTETLIGQYLPIALMDEVMVERVRNGEPVVERDIEVPQRCAYLVMEIMKLRAKLKGYSMAQVESMLPVVDVIGWLQSQKHFIEKAAKDAPRDVLTLEVEESIDETTDNLGTSEGVPGAI